LAFSSSLAAKVFADGGFVTANQILFNVFIFIPFRDAVLAKPFISQTAWVIYYGSCRVVLALVTVVASSSGHLVGVTGYKGAGV
jgi:hypothetical protein